MKLNQSLARFVAIPLVALCVGLSPGCGSDHDETPTDEEDPVEEAPPALSNCEGTLPPDGQINPIDGEAWRHSLALDATGCPHVTLYQEPRDADTARLEYARWDGRGWQVEQVAELSRSSNSQDLAIDPDGNPTVAFFGDNRTSLRFAQRDASGQWSSEKIADVVPWAIVHEYDRAGRAVIAAIVLTEPYSLNETEIMYFRKTADGWVSEVVHAEDNMLVLNDALAFDSEGRPHLGIAGSGGGGVFYGTRSDDASWSTEQLVAAPDKRTGVASIAVDQDDRLHFIYGHSSGDNNLLHLYQADGDWQSQVIDTTEFLTPWFSALSFDGSGKLHAFYGSGSGNVRLRHAVWDGTSWAAEELGEVISGDIDVKIDSRTGVAQVLTMTDADPSSTINRAVSYTTVRLAPAQP